LESAYGVSIGEVINDVTGLSDVMLVTSQSSVQSHRVRKLGTGSTRPIRSESRLVKPQSTICVDPLSIHSPTIAERCVKISSFGLELWEKKHLG